MSRKWRLPLGKLRVLSGKEVCASLMLKSRKNTVPGRAQTLRPARSRAQKSRLAQLAHLGHWLARKFPQVRLTVELVPKTCWYSNVRSNVTPDEWNRLRRAVCERTGWVCEVCGGRGQEHPVECHEIWQYDDAARVQKLIGLVGLCPSCHAAKHLGRSKLTGRRQEVLRHLAAVNGWTPRQIKEYVRAVFAVWKLRSGVKWRLDLGWLSAQGVLVKADGAERP